MPFFWDHVNQFHTIYLNQYSYVSFELLKHKKWLLNLNNCMSGLGMMSQVHSLVLRIESPLTSISLKRDFTEHFELSWYHQL